MSVVMRDRWLKVVSEHMQVWNPTSRQSQAMLYSLYIQHAKTTLYASVDHNINSILYFSEACVEVSRVK